MSITDGFSRKVTVFPMKKKSDVFECFKKLQNKDERFLDIKIKNIRTDNGMEFCHKDFSKFLSEQGVKSGRTSFCSAPQNGASEQCNLAVLDGIKSMLKKSGIHNRFWAEALIYFTYGIEFDKKF